MRKSVTLRPAVASEQDAILDLLDHWPFQDERRGREFFARSVRWDPRYSPENFWVAERAGRLLSCVQVFPRWVRLRGQPVPTGGIGSVFTHPDARREGLAEALLAATVVGMVERGFELSLLWASRVEWYEKLGWTRWGGEMFELVPGEDAWSEAPRSGPEIERFDEDVHLAAVEELASNYDLHRGGSVVRNRDDWRASLRLAGEPHEEFVVTRPTGGLQLTSFLRGTVLGSRWTATQWAHDGTSEGIEDLALVLSTLRRAMGIEAIRIPALRDPALERALTDRGLQVRQVSSLWQPRGEDGASTPSFWFLRALQPEALSERFFGSAEPLFEESELGQEEALLEALAPRREFCFWPADRF